MELLVYLLIVLAKNVMIHVEAQQIFGNFPIKSSKLNTVLSIQFTFLLYFEIWTVLAGRSDHQPWVPSCNAQVSRKLARKQKVPPPCSGELMVYEQKVCPALWTLRKYSRTRFKTQLSRLGFSVRCSKFGVRCWV